MCHLDSFWNKKKKMSQFNVFFNVPLKAFFCYLAGDWKAIETICGCSFTLGRMFNFPLGLPSTPFSKFGHTVEMNDVFVIAFIFDFDTTCSFARYLVRRSWWGGGGIHHLGALWNCLVHIFSILLCHDDQCLVTKCPNSLVAAEIWTFDGH